MANRYDVRNLHGMGGRSEELQTAVVSLNAKVEALRTALRTAS